MSSSESTTPDGTSQPYVLIPNLYIPDQSADEVELPDQSWMVATVIDDDDITFGGKPLCAWYEEDRRRLSSCIDEEETRGRPRARVSVESHHHHHHHKPQHNQHLRQHSHHDKKTAQVKQ